MSVDNWKELTCGQCGEESKVYMRGKDLADHKLEVHGPSRDQLEWAVRRLHDVLHGLLGDAYVATTIRMYDEYTGSTHFYGHGVAVVNHAVVQRTIRGN